MKADIVLREGVGGSVGTVNGIPVGGTIEGSLPGDVDAAWDAIGIADGICGFQGLVLGYDSINGERACWFVVDVGNRQCCGP